MDQPSHICGNILDLIFTNCESDISNLFIHSSNSFGISSDHYPITFSFSYSSSHTIHKSARYVFDYSKGDYISLNQFISTCDLTAYYNTTNVNSAWAILKELLLSGMDLFIPKIKLKPTQYPNWFSPTIRHHLKCLRTLRKKLHRHFTLASVQRLIQLEELTQQELYNAKETYEKELINSYAQSKNPKLFRYIKSITKFGSLLSILVNDSVKAVSDKDKAELFNQYFYSVFTDAATPLPNLEEVSIPSSAIPDITLSFQDIFEELRSLQTSKAVGPDNIGPKVLNSCADSLTAPLHHLFSLSLANGVIPSDWKCHNIIPVYKSRDKSSVKNYRPISLLCNVSKVLERLVHNKLLDFYSDSISRHQFGFCKNKSTLQQLLLCFDDLCSDKKQTDSIYLDFSKAFDSVSHTKLLLKLWSAGITGDVWSWLRSYLSDRSQRVLVNNSLSCPLPVKSGVPQGSILGPLLFIIYVNDLCDKVENSTIFKFADDLKCFKAIHCITDSNQLQNDLNSLYGWSLDNDLSFSIKKCVVLRFKVTLHDTNYFINGVHLSNVTEHHDVGIVFSKNLSWASHIDSTVAKAYKSFGLLRRTFKNTFSSQARKTLYLTLVRSKLLYCSALWRPHLMKDILLLEQVQRRATKFILNNYTMDYKTRLFHLKLLPLMYVLELHDVLFLIKSLNSPTSSFNISDHVCFNNSRTRSSSSKLCHRNSDNVITAISYFYRIPRLWNALPIIDLSLSLPTIKHKLIIFLWNHFTNTFDTNSNCTLHFFMSL